MELSSSLHSQHSLQPAVHKRKGKEEYLYSAIYTMHSLKALRHGSHIFTCKLHHACLSFKSVHQMELKSRHPIAAYYSFIDPEGMIGWVGSVGWPIADGLSTQMVTRQVQVERRTGKVHRPKSDVLPLCHTTRKSWKTRQSSTVTRFDYSKSLDLTTVSH